MLTLLQLKICLNAESKLHPCPACPFIYSRDSFLVQIIFLCKSLFRRRNNQPAMPGKWWMQRWYESCIQIPDNISSYWSMFAISPKTKPKTKTKTVWKQRYESIPIADNISMSLSTISWWRIEWSKRIRSATTKKTIGQLVHRQTQVNDNYHFCSSDMKCTSYLSIMI